MAASSDSGFPGSEFRISVQNGQNQNGVQAVWRAGRGPEET